MQLNGREMKRTEHKDAAGSSVKVTTHIENRLRGPEG